MLGELWSEVRYRVRAIGRRTDLERELDDELRAHLELEAEKLERAGLGRDEARRQARVAFGGIDRTKEESRDARGTMLLESVLQDARYAIRGLRAKPAFTVGIVMTLALGIGANVAMFGTVDRMLFRAPDYLRDPRFVHRVYMSAAGDPDQRVWSYTSFPRYLDFLRWTHAFSSIATFATWHIAVGDGEAARPTPVAGVSASYFDFFDAPPPIGRFFSAREDAAPTGAPVVVLSYAYWRSQLGGRADVLGHQLRVGHTLCTIIGVAPKGFIGVEDESVPAMYIPITTFLWDARSIDYTRNYNWQGRYLIVRRRPEFSVATANTDLTAAFRRSWIAANEASPASAKSIATADPRAMLGPVQLERGPLAGPEARVLVWVTGVAAIVLLIACANVANLLLARAVTRRREIALRLALGVSRARLIRQLATESLALALLGGSVGLGVAQWGGKAVQALFLAADAAPPNILRDSRTLAATLVATLGAAMLTGLAPAMQTIRYDLARSLNAGGRDAGARPSRLRTTLLVFQSTLSVVLLVGAGLFVRSLLNVRDLHLGYDVRPVVVVTDNPRGVKLTTTERIALEQRLVDAARAMPGVESATPVSSVPFWGYEQPYLFVSGDTVNRHGNFVLQAGNPDYFRTMGTRLVRGRSFDDHDRADAVRVAVISQSMATLLWPASDPIGKCIRIGADTEPCTTVVGISEDLHMRSLKNGQREYTYYIPIAQRQQAAGMLLVRVAGDATEYLEPIRRQLMRAMPGAAYVTAEAFQHIIDPTMQSWRFGATMFIAFGVLALTIAGVGLYSMVAYGVEQRRREIGVRVALGASRASVVRLVVRGGLRLVVLGVILGSVISLWAGKWVATLLFDEAPNDPVIYATVAAVLLGISLVATSVPALAASRVDPNVALRAD